MDWSWIVIEMGRNDYHGKTAGIGLQGFIVILSLIL